MKKAMKRTFHEVFLLHSLFLFEPLQFARQLAQLAGEPVHRPLEGGQQVEGHHDGEADGGDGGEDGFIHIKPASFRRYPAHRCV